MSVGNNSAQKFYLSFDDEGFYIIKSVFSGKCLTIKDENSYEESEIIQAEYKNLDSQKWILKDSKINGWEIVSYLNTDLAITVDGNIQNGAKLILSKIENTNNQMFYISNITEENKTKANGIYKIAVGKDSSKTFNILNTDNNEEKQINIINYENDSKQKYYLEYDQKGFYKIISLYNGNSITINENNKDINLKEYTGLDSQKWVVIDSKINGWIIAPFLRQELCLSINGKIESNSEILLSKNEKNDRQMFYMFNITEENKTKVNGIYKIAVGKDPSKTLNVLDNEENKKTLNILNYRK